MNNIRLSSKQDYFLQWIYIHCADIMSSDHIGRLILEVHSSGYYEPKDIDTLNAIRAKYINKFHNRDE